MKIAASDLSWKGVQSIQVRVELSASNFAVSEALNANFVDPCESLVFIPQPLLDMTTTLNRDSPEIASFEPFADDKSLLYFPDGSGFNLCGPRSYVVTTAAASGSNAPAEYINVEFNESGGVILL